MNGVAVNILRILDGASDFTRLHVFTGFGHCLNVFFKRCIFIEGKQSRESLRDALGCYNSTRLFRNLSTRLRSHDDIAIVGKNNYRISVYLIYRIQQFLSGRIHGLPTRYHVVNAKAFQDSRIAGTSSYRNKADSFMGCFLLCFKLLSTLLALQLHVVNEYLKDLTALQEVRKDLIGGI